MFLNVRFWVLGIPGCEKSSSHMENSHTCGGWANSAQPTADMHTPELCLTAESEAPQDCHVKILSFKGLAAHWTAGINKHLTLLLPQMHNPNS